MRLVLIEDKNPDQILSLLEKENLKISPELEKLTDCVKWLKSGDEAPKTSPENISSRAQSRLIVKKGKEYQAIKVREIAYFFTDNKVVFVVDKDNRKFLLEKKPLARLEQQLDKKMFCRINRKYLVNADFIKSFRPITRYRIKLQMSIDMNEDLIISQDNTTQFKKWIGDE